MNHRYRSLLPSLLLLVVLVTACARDNSAEETRETASVTPAATETPAAPTATPTQPPTATPTATATPLSPAVTAIEQALDEDGTVVISSVTLPDGGWAVVYADEAGEPGQVLGYTEVGPGSSSDIPVTVDPYLATPTMHVRLHQDAGEAGEFEYPGADEPLPAAEPAAATFPVDVQVVIPALSVGDQEVSREQSQIVVDQVSAPGPAWVALHADDGGEPGTILGQTPVREGQNDSVVIDFDWRRATRPLHVVLYRDEGESGRFEPDTADSPVAVGETPVAASFLPTLPEDVFVINQPASTGEVHVERVLINAPGWLAVYSDFSGYADRLLGYVPLEPGATDNLVVPIEEGDITSLVHIMLHEDLETEGEFEYPGPDQPLRREGRMQLFSFQTDTGSYVETEDQTLTGNQMAIPLVVADVDLWLAIHADGGEEPGEIIGQTLLSPGVHREVTVTVDTDEATPLLYAVLHLDAEPLGEFEPEDSDVPLRFEGNFIRVPFTVEIEAEIEE